MTVDAAPNCALNQHVSELVDTVMNVQFDPDSAFVRSPQLLQCVPGEYTESKQHQNNFLRLWIVRDGIHKLIYNFVCVALAPLIVKRDGG